MTRMEWQAASDNTPRTMKEQAAFDAFLAALTERAGPNASFAEIEAAGLKFGNELCLQHQRHNLEERAARWTSEELVINGALYRYHGSGSEVIHGLCGSFRIQRPSYREVGVHNGRVIIPLDVDAGLLSGATPALAFKLCEGYAQGPSRQVHKALRSSHREPPSRSTMERIAKDLGDHVGDAVGRIEPVVRAQEQLPAEAHALAVGLDRTSAPMEEPLEGEALAKYRNRRTKPYVRSAPEPVEVNFRMAYVGTVSTLDVDGRAIVTRRYGASAEQGPDAILERMMADVEAVQAKRPQLPIILVQDGAPEMWNLTRAALAATVGDVPLFEAIDRHHVAERLSAVLAIAKMPQGGRDAQLREWNRCLDNDDSAVDQIERKIVELRDRQKGKAREALDAQLTYFANNKDRMRYASLREAGLPVGSGPTEGACKSLVMVRAKGCGQRWHQTGLDAVLTLRGLDMSERLAPVFELFAREKVGSLRIAA